MWKLSHYPSLFYRFRAIKLLSGSYVNRLAGHIFGGMAHQRAVDEEHQLNSKTRPASGEDSQYWRLELQASSSLRREA
jgi:hypothetical protein